MRTAQYVFVLITQIVMLCLMFAFGAKVVDMSQHRYSTTTSDVDPSRSGQGPSNLLGYLSR